MLCRVVILADESARWRIAGLRQLERLALEVKEGAAARAETAEIFIAWPAEVGSESKFLPQHPRLSPRDFTATQDEKAELLFSTRMFPDRKSPPEEWEYLESPAQIPACEKRFLEASGKSQDGLVSRFLNRPISRTLTRALLRTPLTPSMWTLAIFVLPLIGAGFLARGDYGSVVVGLLIFQFYSILDGCDGEIARAKYLESARGRQFDTWCDMVGNFLLAVSLGYGIFRLPEGILVAILIATNEFLLARLAASGNSLPVNSEGALYPRHQQMVARSGLRFLGGRCAGWLLQLTKRDVAFVFFLLLAIAGQPAWILHLLGAVALLSSLLALRSLSRR